MTIISNSFFQKPFSKSCPLPEVIVFIKPTENKQRIVLTKVMMHLMLEKINIHPIITIVPTFMVKLLGFKRRSSILLFVALYHSSCQSTSARQDNLPEICVFCLNFKIRGNKISRKILLAAIQCMDVSIQCLFWALSVSTMIRILNYYVHLHRNALTFVRPSTLPG